MRYKHKRIQRYIWVIAIVIGGILGVVRFSQAQSWNPGGTGATCAPTMPGYPGCSLVAVPWASSVTNTNTTTLTAGTWLSPKTLGTGNTRYVLQGNATANSDGILIESNYIIIDLNGYTLTYNNVSPGSGIRANGYGNYHHIAIVNGSIIQGAAKSGTTDPYGRGNNPISTFANNEDYGWSNFQASNLYLQLSGNNLTGISCSNIDLVAETIIDDRVQYGTIIDRHSGVNAIGNLYSTGENTVIRNSTIINAKHRGINMGSGQVYNNVITLRGLNTNGYGVFIYGENNIVVRNNTINGFGSHPIGVGIINSGVTNIDVYENKITLAKTLYAEEELNCSAGIRAGSYGSPPGDVLTDIRIFRNEINLSTQQDYSGQYAANGNPVTFDQCAKGLFIGGGVGSDVTIANNLVTINHTGPCYDHDILSSAISPFGMFSDSIFVLKNTIKGTCSNVVLADDYSLSAGGYPLFAGNNFVRLGLDVNYATIRAGLDGYFDVTGRFVDNIYTNSTEYSHDLQFAGQGSTDVYWGHINGGSWQYDYRCTGSSCGAITPTTLSYAVPADYATWGDPPTGGGGTPDTESPTWPTGTTFSANATSSSSITVTWSPATDNVGVTGYIVERCQGSGCSNFAQVGTPSSSPFVDTGLTANTFYNYHVKARDAAGNESGWSNVVGATTQAPDTQVPTAPSNLQASVVSSSNINLTWTASTDNVAVTDYKVERCAGASCTNFAEIGTPTTANYSDTGLSPETLYRYRVRATDAANNNSGYSGISEGTTPATPPVSASLMLGLNFNEGTGSTTSDVSGNNNTGTITGATWNTTGKYGNSLTFNGTSNIVRVNDANTLDLTNALTLSAWVYPTGAPSTWGTIIMKETSGDASYGLFSDGTSDRPHVYLPGVGDALGTSVLPNNTWTHLAGTYDGSNVKLYINGALTTTTPATGSLISSAGQLSLGGNTVWGDYFTGRIDDVRIYNTALTQTEIQTDMNTPLALGGGGTPTSCNTVTTANFSQSAYNSYGAPYDLFASNAQLVDAKCTSSDPTTISATIGKTGDTTRIAYTKGYYYDPGISDWAQFTGTCAGTLNGDWCAGPVTATITDADISTASASAPAYFVGMTCRMQSGSWKCGCRDTTCASFLWQVQGAGM